MSYQQIPVNLIDPSPFNKRRNVEKPLDSISHSGPVVPLKARPKPDGRFELVFGHRRLAELQRQGIPTAPVIVQEMDDAQVLREQWEENFDREDFTDYETALSLKQMLDTYKITQVQLGEKIGKSPSWITKHLHLLKLEQYFPGEILNQITEKQGSVILAAPEELQKVVIDNVLEQYNAEKTLPSATEIQKIINDLIKLSKEDEEPADHEHVYDSGSTTCRICGRELTAPESVKAGIGPVCANTSNTPNTSNTSTEVQGTPERFSGEHEINQAIGIEPKPLTVEDRAFALLDDLHARFGEPSNSFMIDQLRDKLHIYIPESSALIKKYKDRAKPATDAAPPFKLTPEPEAPRAKAIHLCPLCGKPNLQPDLNKSIEDLTEFLVTMGVLPIGQAERVEEALRRHIP